MLKKSSALGVHLSSSLLGMVRVWVAGSAVIMLVGGVSIRLCRRCRLSHTHIHTHTHTYTHTHTHTHMHTLRYHTIYHTIYNLSYNLSCDIMHSL